MISQKIRLITLKYSTRKWLALALALSFLAGCGSTSAPKPIITQPVDNKEEQLRLETASKAFSQALKALNDQEFETGRDILISLARQYPEYAGIYANLGIAQMKLGEDESAQKSFKVALDKKPIFPNVHNQLGLLHRQHGRFKEAELAYKAAIEQDENYADAHRNLGILYDLYMLDLNNALLHYLKYQELAKPEKTDPVHKWIIDLTYRLNPAK